MMNQIIEQLDELGRVEVGDLTMEEIEEMKRDLDLQGYTTKFEMTDRDYLVLVEKKIVEVMSEDDFNRY